MKQAINGKLPECLTYTIPEVAKLLGVNVITAYNLAKQKGFPAVRIGQKRIIVPKAALERWLERQACI